MLQTFEALKSSVGLDIPDILNKLATGGLVGRSLDCAAEADSSDCDDEQPVGAGV